MTEKNYNPPSDSSYIIASDVSSSSSHVSYDNSDDSSSPPAPTHTATTKIQGITSCHSSFDKIKPVFPTTPGSGSAATAAAPVTGREVGAMGLNQRRAPLSSAINDYIQLAAAPSGSPRDDDDDMEKGRGTSSTTTTDDNGTPRRRRHAAESPSHPYGIYLLSRALRRVETIHIRDVPLLAGTRHVVTGSCSASEVVTVCGVRPPRYVWYSFSGCLCDVTQFVVDVVLFRILRVREPAACWAISFAASVVVRHSSHGYLVFGTTYVGGYWSSLARMYGGYSISIVVSTCLNHLLGRFTNVSHYGLWFITMLWTGVVNYFILKRLWNFDSSKIMVDRAVHES